MSNDFKKSMSWIHTWLGLIAGWILFTVFVTGTSSYYHHEISSWMKPKLTQSKVSENTPIIAIGIANELARDVANFSLSLPTQRQSTISIMYRDRDPDTKRRIKVFKEYDAITAQEIIPRQTAGGDFLFRFHFKLHGIPKFLGEWIVAIATFCMFIAIITGVLIHKRIFKDIFVFRPEKRVRNWMDGHILPAVAAIPFLIMITYSGLILSIKFMMPWAVESIYENPRVYNHEIRALNSNQKIKADKKANKKSELSEEKLIEIYKQANILWPNNIGGFQITRNKKTGLEVKFWQKDHNSIFYSKFEKKLLVFDGNTKKFKYEASSPSSSSGVVVTQSTFDTLHRARFADSSMRFTFFLFGILGTIVVATGLILWNKKRQSKYENKNHLGYKIVEKLNIGTIIGMFIAIASYFIANRLIPLDIENRAILEIKIFFITWLSSYIWAFLRNSKNAWNEQALFTSILFIVLIFINAFTINNSIYEFIQRELLFYYFDLFFLLCAFMFFIIFKKTKIKTIGDNDVK